MGKFKRNTISRFGFLTWVADFISFPLLEVWLKGKLIIIKVKEILKHVYTKLLTSILNIQNKRLKVINYTAR